MLLCCLQCMEGTRRPHRWGFLLQGSGGQARRSRSLGPVQDASEDRVGEEGQEARGEGTVQKQRGDAHSISAEQRKRGSCRDWRKLGLQGERAVLMEGPEGVLENESVCSARETQNA